MIMSPTQGAIQWTEANDVQAYIKLPIEKPIPATQAAYSLASGPTRPTFCA